MASIAMVDPARIPKRCREPVHVEPIPEWGGVVHIRRLSALEHLDLKASRGSANEYVSKLLTYSLCDEHGKDVPTILDAITSADEGSQVIVEKLAGLCLEVHGLTAAAEAARAKN